MSITTHVRQPATRLEAVLTRIAMLLAVSIFIGWFYAWGHAHFYPEKTRAGFAHGVIHGALMPMALPSLVMGNDVKIYDDNNTGRNYKLGYICGINACGFFFFGSIFWKPRRHAGLTKSNSGKSQ